MQTNAQAPTNPAIQAAEKSLGVIYECIESGKSFLLEAGAGSGKTESLVRALRFLVKNRGTELVRRNAKVACISFTNVASDTIRSRTDDHPAIFSSTIHAFCWSLIKDFQPFLRNALPDLPGWGERLAEGGGVAGRDIEYELGFPSAKTEDERISLDHGAVLALTVKLLEQPKFRRLVLTRYPVIFIDEYQDTDKNFVNSLLTHFIGKEGAPLIGFFGDHWQRIYGEESCGHVEHQELVVVEQKSNFRSTAAVVDVLNRLRPELPQAVADPDAKGEAAAYHTNGWTGKRRSGAGGHWTGDLPADAAHEHLRALISKLEKEGWDFSQGKTKVLMLTHGVLAAEQGYSSVQKIFSRNPAAFWKKEDRLIKFLLEVVEPMSRNYSDKRYGEMFSVLGSGTPTIRTHADKEDWARDMSRLLEIRSAGTVGEVIEHLKGTKRPRLPDSLERRERDLARLAAEGGDESTSLGRYRELKAVRYEEILALAKFVDAHSPYATKHGVKGDEFENVLVVAGRGWNHYDFNRLLEWLETPAIIPADRTDFERYRNLFYVACSRPRKRLAVLFTQELSAQAMRRLTHLFGGDNVHQFAA